MIPLDTDMQPSEPCLRACLTLKSMTILKVNGLCYFPLVLWLESLRDPTIRRQLSTLMSLWAGVLALVGVELVFFIGAHMDWICD